jgi:argininosuccinate lyase
VLELTRANAAVLESFLHRILSVAGRLPSSYHRDYQVTKEPLVRGIDLTIKMTRAMVTVVEGLEFDKAACDAAVTDETFCAHRAFELAAEGVPFREAYKRTAEEHARGAVRRPRDLGPVLAAYKVEGAAGDLRLDQASERLDRLAQATRSVRSTLDACLSALEQDRA